MYDEWIWILLILFIFWGLPLILAITSLVKIGGLRKEIHSLRQDLLRRTLLQSIPEPALQTAPKTAQESIPAPITPPPLPPKPSPQPAPQPTPSPKTPTSPPDEAIYAPLPRSPFNEILVGGKLASFAGMGLVLIGIALLIGYAVRHSWFGPGARVLLGLVSGAVCVALGHLAEVKGNQKLHILARSLTGGGAAIFYFCVFAAHGFYELIPIQLAAAGLLLSAAATLGLALAYRSQAVAVIGVLGAFLMPAFLEDLADNRLFFLGYIALINLPVIVLGLQRKWQALYNLAFGFTFFFVFILAASHSPARRDGLLLLTFGFIYFLEFIALGLLKLRHERDIHGRNADIIRLLLTSLGFLGLLYHDLEAMDLNAWTAPAMLGIALLHIGFVRIGWKAFPAFALDNLALLVGALTYASLALPVQLDGAWVSTGWAIEGLILCAFALRAKIPLLQVIATLLGLLGLMKAMVFDVQFYTTAPDLFLNARFASGLISALLLGAQGGLHRRHASENDSPPSSSATLLLSLGILGILLVFCTNIFWTLGSRDSAAWLLSTFFLVIVAIASAMSTQTETSLSRLALILCGLIPLKLFLDLIVIYTIGFPDGTALFWNAPFRALLALTVLSLFIGRELPRREPFPPLLAGNAYAVYLNLSSLAAAILIVTTELYRIDSDWNQTGVTIWWATCAMALVVAGLLRNVRAHRRAGLVLFTLTTAKVLLVDMSELEGLDRITGFLVAGVLLLILSFLYQRASTRLQENTP